MTLPTRPHGALAAIETAPAALLDEPLDYLFAEHWRHRQLCRALADLASAKAARPEELRAFADFLTRELTLHAEDEECDLFELLRARAGAEDDLERIFGILTADHAGDRAMAAALCEGLEAAAAASIAPARQPGLADLIGRFVTHKMRHIALENAIVLPIARLRLTAADLQALASGMKARRADSHGP